MGGYKRNQDPEKKLLLTKQEAAYYVGVDVSVINDMIDMGQLKVNYLLGKTKPMINRLILEETLYNLARFDPDPKKVEAFNRVLYPHS